MKLTIPFLIASLLLGASSVTANDAPGLNPSSPIPVLRPTTASDAITAALPSDPISFAGRWQLVEFTDPEGRITSLPPGGDHGAAFQIDSDGRLTGSAGCNHLFGRVEQFGHALAPIPVTSTFIGCLGDLGRFEGQFIRILEEVRMVSHSHQMLIFLDADGDKLAEFQRL